MSLVSSLLDLSEPPLDPGLPSGDEILGFSEDDVPFGTLSEERPVDRSGGKSGLTGILLESSSFTLLVYRNYRDRASDGTLAFGLTLIS